MAGFTRVNPTAGYTNGAGVDTSGHTHGVLFSTLQLKAFIVDAGASLAAQGGNGGAIEAVARELATTGAMMESSGTAGKFIVIGDGHAIDATILQRRIRQLGTVNSYDFSGATVSELTSLFAVSAS